MDAWRKPLKFKFRRRSNFFAVCALSELEQQSRPVSLGNGPNGAGACRYRSYRMLVRKCSAARGIFGNAESRWLEAGLGYLPTSEAAVAGSRRERLDGAASLESLECVLLTSGGSVIMLNQELFIQQSPAPLRETSTNDDFAWLPQDFRGRCAQGYHFWRIHLSAYV